MESLLTSFVDFSEKRSGIDYLQVWELLLKTSSLRALRAAKIENIRVPTDQANDQVNETRIDQAKADTSGTCRARGALKEHHAVEDCAKASCFFAHPRGLRAPLAVSILARIGEERSEFVIGHTGDLHLLAKRFSGPEPMEEERPNPSTGEPRHNLQNDAKISPGCRTFYLARTAAPR